MRYDPLRKIERNQAIVKMQRDHPELALREIAQHFGITRKRVWAIIKRQKELTELTRS